MKKFIILLILIASWSKSQNNYAHDKKNSDLKSCIDINIDNDESKIFFNKKILNEKKLLFGIDIVKKRILYKEEIDSKYFKNGITVNHGAIEFLEDIKSIYYIDFKNKMYVFKITDMDIRTVIVNNNYYNMREYESEFEKIKSGLIKDKFKIIWKTNELIIIEKIFDESQKISYQYHVWYFDGIQFLHYYYKDMSNTIFYAKEDVLEMKNDISYYSYNFNDKIKLYYNSYSKKMYCDKSLSHK